MKPLLILLTTIACIITFTSCKKPHSADSTNKVKTYTEDITSSSIGNSVTTYNLAYDGNNRVISMISTPSPDNKFLITYNSGNKYSLDIYKSNILYIHEDFFNNGNLCTDSTFQYNNTADTSTEKYFYNINNQLIAIKQYDFSTSTQSQLSNTIDYTYDTNGNLIMTSSTDTNVDTYEYYTDLSYLLPAVIGLSNSNTTKKYYLVKKHTLTSNGYFVASAVYTYTFDANNRISTQKAIDSDGNVGIKTYTYF